MTAQEARDLAIKNAMGLSKILLEIESASLSGKRKIDAFDINSETFDALMDLGYGLTMYPDKKGLSVSIRW